MRQIYYTIRTLLRERGSNIIRIISLSLGLTIGVLLFSQIAFELSYEKCYPEAERLALVRCQMTNLSTGETAGDDGEIGYDYTVFDVVAPTLAEEMPKEIEVASSVLSMGSANIYYEDNIDLTITKTFTKSNLKKLTGYTDYSYYQNAIIINPDDYNSLYDKPSYQSSVYVKDASIIEQTMSELENLGLKPKKATDFKVEYENESQIVKIFKVVVTIFVIIVVFFISYLIISIILKSRNIYYTTLRMLGATSKSTRKILNIELFINSTLSYLMVLTFGYLVKQDIIKIEFIANLIKYITLNECILMYLILFVVTQLIARKFAKKIFKSSAMNRYNEEV